MLSVGKLAHGQESYYLAAVADGVEDYYLGSGEAAGYWTGAGAVLLGLRGQVDADDLHAVLAGRDPHGGDQLVRAGTARRRRVPGFDLTFSAPKSVSVLYAFGGDETAAKVVAAHEAAVAAGLDYLERHATFTRRRREGVIEEVAGEGLVVAAFRHRTSRAGDPQLHTHCVTANLVRAVGGQWGSLDARWVYSQARTAGFVYQAVLRGELTSRLGVEWGPVRNGHAEVAGLDRRLLRLFSQRRVAIEQRLEDAGLHSAAAAQAATLETRRGKDYGVEPEGLHDRWAARAEEAGFRTSTVRATVGAVRGVARDDAAARDRLVGPDGLTAHTASFERGHAVRGWCESLAGPSTSVDELDGLADALLCGDDVIALGGADPGTLVRADGRTVAAAPDRRRYSTRDMLVVEGGLIESAARRVGEGSAVVHPAAVRAVLDGRASLRAEQRALVERITTSGAGVDVVVGKAGTGKTFALEAAAAAWSVAGFRVSGVALAARAAAEMESTAGVPSTTVARFLADLERPEAQLDARQVVVVDEAGMVDTRRLARLLAHAEQARAKVVLVGDHRQLPEVEAGGAFRALARELDSIELVDNRRQHEGWERAALDELREGDVDEALTAYRDNNRIVALDTADAAREHMVQSWHAARSAGDRAVMVAVSNRDVADLNRRARAVRRAAGEIGPDELSVEDRGFAIGDEILCLRNDRLVGVINSSIGTVLHVDRQGRGLVVRLDNGRRVTLPSDYLDAGDVTHAYATTVHKAQGLTVDRTFLLGDDRLYREAGYVGLSRGRTSNHLYVVHHDRDEALELHAVDRDPLDPVEQVTAALTRSAAKRLAMDERAAPAPDRTVGKLPPAADAVDEALRDRLDAARRERAEAEAELEGAEGRARLRALRRLEVIGRHEAWLAGQLAPGEDSTPGGVAAGHRAAGEASVPEAPLHPESVDRSDGVGDEPWPPVVTTPPDGVPADIGSSIDVDL